MPCDNLPCNGDVVTEVVRATVELLHPGMAGGSTTPWRGHHGRRRRRPDYPSTTDEDVRAVAEAAERADRCPVVTEPFAEWAISGTFPADRQRGIRRASR